MNKNVAMSWQNRVTSSCTLSGLFKYHYMYIFFFPLRKSWNLGLTHYTFFWNIPLYLFSHSEDLYNFEKSRYTFFFGISHYTFFPTRKIRIILKYPTIHFFLEYPTLLFSPLGGHSTILRHSQRRMFNGQKLSLASFTTELILFT